MHLEEIAARIDEISYMLMQYLATTLGSPDAMMQVYEYGL